MGSVVKIFLVTKIPTMGINAELQELSFDTPKHAVCLILYVFSYYSVVTASNMNLSVFLSSQAHR